MSQKITIKINNQRLEGFDNISVSRNMENFCANFSFQAFSENKIILPFSPSQDCDIYVENSLFMNGKLDQVNIGYNVSGGSTSHFYNLSGRDQTSMIVDNSIEGNANFIAPINLVDIINKLIANFSTKIKVIGPKKPLEDFKKEELLAAKEGENLFQFLDNLARQRAVFLATNEGGDILIETEQRDRFRVKLFNEIKGKNNNILEGSFAQDYSERYHRYKTFTQTNMSSDINTKPDYNITGSYVDSGANVNTDKYLDIQGEVSTNQTSNNTRAKWEGKVRAARSEVYTVKVLGFVAEDLPPATIKFWEPNKLIDIKDDFLGVNKTLLIKSVKFDYSSSTGSITTLELVDKNAYTIEGS